MNAVRILAIPVMTLGVCFATQSFAQTFTYTQIDAPNSSQTFASSSNSYGQIVGESGGLIGDWPSICARF